MAPDEAVLPLTVADLDLDFVFQPPLACPADPGPALSPFLRTHGQGTTVRLRSVRHRPLEGPLPALVEAFRPRRRALQERFPLAQNVTEATAQDLTWLARLGGDEAVQTAMTSVIEGDEPERLIHIRPWGLAVLDPPKAKGEAFLIEALTPEEQTAAFHQLLSLCVSAFLAARSGLLLHGAGVVRHGQGHVFLGLSGAGKSTVARLSGAGVLSDDGVIVRCGDGRFQVHRAPLLQVAPHGPPPGPAPLRGLHFLRQGLHHDLTPRDPVSALGELLHNHIHFFKTFPAPLAGEAFATAAALLRQTQPTTLTFARNAGFWALLGS